MENIILVIALIMSAAIVLITVPPIVRVARAKHIFDITDHRKVHTKSIPTLGGISIFMAITLCTTILTAAYPAPGNQILLAAMIMLFFVGIKDDIIFIAPQTKFFLQLLAAFLLVTLGDFYIANFEGIIGWHKIPPIISYTFTIALIVLLINAYNLIDGIDGLAGLLGLSSSLIFAVWFFLNGQFAMAILSTAIVGSLLGFLRFNLFSKKYKIFMGDTGSLILGLLMAAQVISFLNINFNSNIAYPMGNGPGIALALVALPLVDTLRVFTLRIVRGLPPFHPDKNHIHHRMIAILPNHLHSSLSLTAGNLLIIVSAMFLGFTGMNINVQFFIILLLSASISVFPGIMVGIIRRRGEGRPIKPFSELELKVMNQDIIYQGKPVRFPKPNRKKEKEVKVPVE